MSIVDSTYTNHKNDFYAVLKKNISNKSIVDLRTFVILIIIFKSYTMLLVIKKNFFKFHLFIFSIYVCTPVCMCSKILCLYTEIRNWSLKKQTRQLLKTSIFKVALKHHKTSVNKTILDLFFFCFVKLYVSTSQCCNNAVRVPTWIFAPDQDVSRVWWKVIHESQAIR